MTSRASLGSGEQGILVHHAGEQGAVERAPVHADAHRLLILDGDFDHGAEVVVVLAADADVAGIDAVLGERARALGILLQQQMAVVVEVADDRDADALLVEFVDDGRDGGGGFFVVDGDADQFGAGPGEGGDLLDGRGDVGRVGVGHGLHHDRCIAADAHTADGGCNCLSTLNLSHGKVYFNTRDGAVCAPRRARTPVAPSTEIGKGLKSTA